MDDKLKQMARQAVADADQTWTDNVLLRAVQLLRERDRERLTIDEYLAAVDWAMTHPAAADLPGGSVVASPSVAFIKDRLVPDRPWSCTDGGHAPDEEIDRYLGLNAKVLRVGTGEEGN